MLAALDTTDDLYFDMLRQARMERWSNGRVVLTGDAGLVRDAARRRPSNDARDRTGT